MKFPTHLARAMTLVSALVLSACGGGDSGSGPGSTPSIEIAPFIAIARAEQCSDIRNRLFIIDNKMVLSERAGNCPDNSYAVVLYGATVDTILCQARDSIAGPMVSCNDKESRPLFDTIRNNLDKPDLGLGAGYTVEQVAFLP